MQLKDESASRGYLQKSLLITTKHSPLISVGLFYTILKIIGEEFRKSLLKANGVKKFLEGLIIEVCKFGELKLNNTVTLDFLNNSINFKIPLSKKDLQFVKKENK